MREGAGVVFPMAAVYKGGAEEATAIVDSGRASLFLIALPSSDDAETPFNLPSLGSEHFIQWDHPPPQDDSSSVRSPFALVVLLGWLGSRQRHLRRYADLYRDRGVRSVRFVVPFRELLGLDLGRRAQRMVAELSAVIAAWCDADRRRTLLFHTFSIAGWLIYGAVLENLQSRADIIQRIRGCIIDSAPVLEIRPEVWAAGFSNAMLKKNSFSPVDSPDGCPLNGDINKVNYVSELTKPSWGESFLLSTLHKFFQIVLHFPDVNRRLRKVLAVLSEKQPACPQLYLYSSADRVVPAEYVQSFIGTRRSLGLNVSAHNFVSSPHVATTGASLTCTRPRSTSSSSRSVPHLDYDVMISILINEASKNLADFIFFNHLCRNVRYFYMGSKNRCNMTTHQASM